MTDTNFVPAQGFAAVPTQVREGLYSAGVYTQTCIVALMQPMGENTDRMCALLTQAGTTVARHGCRPELMDFTARKRMVAPSKIWTAFG
jgi:hypothetical protein